MYSTETFSFFEIRNWSILFRLQQPKTTTQEEENRLNQWEYSHHLKEKGFLFVYFKFLKNMFEETDDNLIIYFCLFLFKL